MIHLRELDNEWRAGGSGCMRRFRCKGVLVLVAALLLLGDRFWVRGGIPQLDDDTRLAESAISVAQVIALSPVQARPVISDVPTRRPQTTNQMTKVTDAASASPATTHGISTITPVPAAVEPVVAQENHTSPVVWLGSTPLAATLPPIVRLDDALPPRKWSPPEGIAYIRWWTA